MNRLRRPLRIYPTPGKGIWRIEFEYTDGSRRWSSLHTRSRTKAEAEFERYKTWFAKLNEIKP